MYMIKSSDDQNENAYVLLAWSSFFAGHSDIKLNIYIYNDMDNIHVHVQHVYAIVVTCTGRPFVSSSGE